MADLQKTIKGLEDWIDTPFAMNAEIDPKLVHDALELLKERQWIPVTERMPDEYDSVEVWEKYGKISCTAYFAKGKWTICGTCGESCLASYEVSHWRKPQPPQEVSQVG